MDTQINKWINLIEDDIIDMIEINYNWWFRDSTPVKERARKWCHTPGMRNGQLAIFAHNEYDIEAPQFQIGGVVLIIRGQTVYRVIEK